MRKILSALLVLLWLGYSKPLLAQGAAAILFTDFLERFPKPLATLDETMAFYGSYEKMDNEVRYANKEIDGSLTTLYTPLLELFLKRMNGGSKVPLAGVSKEEQDLLTSFKIGSQGMSTDNLMNWLKIRMDHGRPFVGSGKLSWTKLHPSASPSVLQLYQELKQLEGMFDWAGFTKQAEHYKPKFGESEDEGVKKVQQNFDAAFKKLPKKKVKVMEGFYNEVEDPEKAIALLLRHKEEGHQAFENQYAIRYQWWSKAHQKLTVISQRLDAIAAQLNSKVSTEADRSIYLAIADIQGRTWEAWQRLAAVTQGLFMNAMIAATAKLQVDASIEIYRKYKVDSE